MACNVVWLRMVSDEFGHHLIVCNEIDQRDESAIEKMRLDGANERTASDMIAHHLRHSEERGFEGGSATSDQCGVRVLQQRESSGRHKMHMRMALQIRRIFLQCYTWSCGYDGLKSLQVGSVFGNSMNR